MRLTFLLSIELFVMVAACIGESRLDNSSTVDSICRWGFLSTTEIKNASGIDGWLGGGGLF